MNARQLKQGAYAGLAGGLVFGVAAGNDWTIASADAGVTAFVCASDNYLTLGVPWDTDGSEACPPDGDDDIRCEWLTDHVAGSPDHPRNGVAAAVLDGSAAQSAVLLSDEWSDSRNSGAICGSITTSTSLPSTRAR